jgi:hypothetical protein
MLWRLRFACAAWYGLIAAVFAFVAIFVAQTARAVPLDPLSTFCTANPTECQRGSISLLAARGIGTSTYYAIEVDPATGQIPVDAAFTFSGNLNEDHNYGTPGASTLRTAAMLGVGSTAVSNANPVPVSDAGGTLTVDGTVAATQSGTWAANISDSSGDAIDTTGGAVHVADGGGTLTVDGTVTVQDGGGTVTVDGTVAATQSGNWSSRTQDGSGNALSSTGGALHVADGGGALTVDGAVTVSDGSGSLTVDGTVATSNFPATADTNAGAAGASTIRTSPASRAYADSVRNLYSSTNVTTGAWVQLIASTAAAINELSIWDSCGEVLELGTGAAAAEARVLLIPPGGIDAPLRIAASTRVSIRAVSGNCTLGQLVMTGLQ